MIPGTIKKCTNCGLLYKLYSKKTNFSEVYGPEYTKEFGGLNYFNLKQSRAKYENILPKLGVNKTQDFNIKPKALEFGCGVGACLDVLKSKGYQVKGLELNNDLVEQIRSRDIDIVSIDALTFSTSEKFDLILAMDFIEHIPSPHILIEKAHSMLNTGGRLIIGTPNHSALILTFAKVLFFFGVKAPLNEIFATNHIQFFCKESLNKTIASYNWSSVQVKYFAYDFNNPGGNVSYISRLAIVFTEILGRLIGKNFFRMYFVITK
jgi:2-polyprenyl-3-methyl-5-hydroxy-6-metoxy-1,4-benzoquinol methylase